MRLSRWPFGAALAVVLAGGWLLFNLQSAPITPAVVSAHQSELLTDAESPTSGNRNGDVTLVEFLDYNCPYCRQMVAVITQVEAADPNLRVVYKEWPILGASSIFPAKAALAANKQGKFIPLHTALYQLRGTLTDDKVLATAESVGLDMAQLKSGMNDPSVDAAIGRNLALARVLAIDGTPGFVIGNHILTGPLDLRALQAAIQMARSG
jgi:protein-disulfide isomerase